MSENSSKTYPKQLSSGKIPLAVMLVVVSTVYAVWQSLGGAPAGTIATSPSVPVATSTASIASSTPPVDPTKNNPSSEPSGQYADGTYTGAPADAFYGTVQVEAIVRSGRLADVIFIQHPGDRDTSIAVNDQAMPMLVREAIQVQSARVNGASGATFTSQAFEQSLADALLQAKN